nr:hypothetical protein [Paracoccus saliphilus]
MTLTNWKMRSTALAAILSLPFAAGSALAQDATANDQNSAMSQGEDAATAGAQDPNSEMQADGQQADDQQAAGNPQPDAVVATVGDAEIRGEDVLAVVGMLPPQLQAQSPQMLIPIALEQLILRELVLEKAQADNLSQDPEVTEMVRRTTEDAEKNAMVQVWLDREMAKAVSDEAVQQSYDEAASQGQQDLPPIEVVRPQIEQHLRQQAMQDIRTQLREGADIVLYDPTGRPIEDQAASEQGSGSSTDTSSDAGGMPTGTETPEAASTPDEPASGTDEDATDASGDTSSSSGSSADMSDSSADGEQPSSN